MNMIQEQIDITLIEGNKHVFYYIAGAAMLIMIVLSIYCVFQASHSVIRPLRKLNSRMREIIDQGKFQQIDIINQDEDS